MVQYDSFLIVFKILNVAQRFEKICSWALTLNLRLKDCFPGIFNHGWRKNTLQTRVADIVRKHEGPSLDSDKNLKP